MHPPVVMPSYHDALSSASPRKARRRPTVYGTCACRGVRTCMALVLLLAVAPILSPAAYGQTSSGAAEEAPECEPSSGQMTPTEDASGERLRPATLHYALAMTFGERTMEMNGVRNIERGTLDGVPVWRIVDVSKWQGGRSADTVEVNRTTLRPRRRIASGRGRIQLDFTEDRVTGVVSQGRGGEQSVDVELSDPVYGGEAAMEAVVAALPLEEGYETRLRTFVPYTQSTRLMNVCVTGTTTVERPGGTTQNVLVVDMTPAEGNGTEWSRLHVFPDAPHYVIEGEYHLPKSAGSGTIMMTLESISFASSGTGPDASDSSP